MAKVISISNQKGGVGKTTTAINLSSALAVTGARVMLIDMDPQANAGSGLGFSGHDGKSVYHVLAGEATVEEVTVKTEVQNLNLVPSHNHLVGAEVELIHAFSRETKLKLALQPVQDRYDIIIIDCPPNLNLLTINALTASNSVLIPLQCEYYALEGLSQLIKTIELIRSSVNPELEIEGILLTMFDPRNNLAHNVKKEISDHFNGSVFETVIPRNIKLSESPSFGKPIVLYDPDSKGCASYLQLARELLSRNPSIVVQQRPIEGFEKDASLPAAEISEVAQPVVEEIIIAPESGQPEYQAEGPEPENEEALIPPPGEPIEPSERQGGG